MKRAVLAVALAAICVLAAACGGAGAGAGSGAEVVDWRGFLSIEGDVEQSVIFTPVSSDSARLPDSYAGGMPLSEFVAQAGISGTPEEVYFISSGDGFCASISYESADKVTVYYDTEKGWHLDAPEHPQPVNAMDVDRFIVVSEGSEAGLPVVRADGSTDVVSFGEMLLAPMTAVYHLDGTSEIGSEAGGTQSVSVYTRRFSVRLADLRPEYEGAPFVVVTGGGGKYLTDGGGRFVVYRQTLTYVEATGDEYEDVTEIQLRES
ncbi:MAG: hypothetical protein LBR44_05985 [Clostridiales Family XIII bacterium]|jgi:hypothetical protein|nr:hypothetical protein [Clostridiales Family XIII bacterium]